MSQTGSPSGLHPLTKAQYEQKLGPLLNYVVDPALHVALSNAGGPLPQKLAAAITDVRLAHDQMAAITPPAGVADLHQKAVALMTSMITDMTKLRAAEAAGDKTAAVSAATALISDGRQMESLGSQFAARGY